MKGSRIGEFEELVLLTVARLRGRAYGATIVEFLADHDVRAVTLGAVYPTLDRLESKGLVRSRIAKPSARKGGRRRRVFTITARGVGALARTHRVRVTLWRGLRRAALRK